MTQKHTEELVVTMRDALKAAMKQLDNSDSPGGCNGAFPHSCAHCAAIVKVRAALRAQADREGE